MSNLIRFTVIMLFCVLLLFICFRRVGRFVALHIGSNDNFALYRSPAVRGTSPALKRSGVYPPFSSVTVMTIIDVSAFTCSSSSIV